MDRMLAGIVIVPGVIALLLFLVFTYLYQQSREAYFRAWQLGWGAYRLYYGLIAFNTYGTISAAERATGNLLLVAMTMCIFVSTRLIHENFVRAGTTSSWRWCWPGWQSGTFSPTRWAEPST